MGYFNLLSFQPNHWASESVMWLGEEGYFWEPTVEKFSPGVDLQALQYPCTRERALPKALGSRCPI